MLCTNILDVFGGIQQFDFVLMNHKELNYQALEYSVFGGIQLL